MNISFGTSNNLSWRLKDQSTGEEFLFRTGTAMDHPELLAQGRTWENAKRKREINSLPLFDNLEEAKVFFINNKS